MISWLFLISIIQIVTGQAAFVAVGADVIGSGARNIAYSLDGISWARVTTNIFSDAAAGVAYSNNQNKWIAVGQGIVNTMAWSPDGIRWIGMGNNLFPSVGNAIVYSPEQNRWVAGGRGFTQLYFSSDGFIWTAANSGIFTGVNGITYSSTLNQWVAVGLGSNTIATSPDGITWTGLGNIIFDTAAYSVRYADGIYIATGASTVTQAWSTDGITWTGTPELVSSSRRDSVYAQGRWLLVGPASVTFQNSTDGKSWTSKANFAGITHVFGITYNSAYNRYVAVGDGTNKIIYSSDGDNWSGTGFVFSNYGWTVSTTNQISQIIINPIPITTDVVNLITNTSIIDNNTTISISGNLIIMGDLAVEGAWILTQQSTVNVTGLLSIKGNTTFNSLQPIECQTLSISSAIGDSQLILMTNLTIGSSITYPLITYSTRSGSFNRIFVRSTNPGCPVATQSYSSSTLSVTVSMKQCTPLNEDVVIRNDNMAMIIGVAVGCVVFAGVAVLILIIVMKKHIKKTDSLQNSKLRDAAINDLQHERLKPSPGANL